jgi:thymidylate kinase
MYYLAAYYEMWIRLLEAKKAGKEIVVFDRYVWEASVNSTSKISHFLACLLFEHLFPKPELVIYLYCSAETSLLRKDDILDEKQFRMMKKRSDEKYLNKNEILSINTEETGIEEVVQMIEKIIEKNKKIG